MFRCDVTNKFIFQDVDIFFGATVASGNACVGNNCDPIFLTKLYQRSLWQIWMGLDLIDNGFDFTESK